MNKIKIIIISILILTFHLSAFKKSKNRKVKGDLFEISVSKMRRHYKAALSDYYTFLEFFKKRKHLKEEMLYFKEILNTSLARTSFDTITLKDKDTFCIIINHQIHSEWNYVRLIYNNSIIELERDSLNAEMKIVDQFKDTVKNDAYFFKRGMLDSISSVLSYGGVSGMRIIKTKNKVYSLFHYW